MKPIIKRMLSGVLSAAMTISATPLVSVHADENTNFYPYTMFAASSDEGAITVNAGNFCVNGNVATNGTIVSSGNMKATADGVTATSGMKIDSVTAEPSTITLTGDSAAVDAVKAVEIRSVFAGETTESVTSKGQIVLLGANGEVIENPDIKYDNESFTVKVTLYKQKTLPLTVQFTNVPSNFDLSSLKYSIYPETLTVSSPDDSLDSNRIPA